MPADHVVQVAVTASGVAWVDGSRVATEPNATAAQARAAALRVVSEMALDGQPLLVHASDGDGAVWQLLVHADGRVEDAAAAQQRTADPAARDVPEDYAQQTRVIVEACKAGRAGVAAVLARQLTDQAVADHGATHPYALQAQELHGAALLQGKDAAGACEAYVTAARGWDGLDSAAYREALHRAYACWQRIDDRASAIWAGEQVAAAARLGGEPTADLVRAALARLDILQAGAIT
ncbi:hypothetical protein ACWEQ8_42180 [Streptomyces noursei]